jgi:hypothetical protein
MSTSSALTLTDFTKIYSSSLKSVRTQLAVFWLSVDGSKVIHSKTVLEEDINPNDSTPHEFHHVNEWHNHPPEYEKSYTFYPRGRIEFDHGKYKVEISGLLLDESIKATVRHYFSLPPDADFTVGLHRHE